MAKKRPHAPRTTGVPEGQFADQHLEDIRQEEQGLFNNRLHELVEPDGKPTTHYAEAVRGMWELLDRWQPGRHQELHDQLMDALRDALPHAELLDMAVRNEE